VVPARCELGFDILEDGVLHDLILVIILHLVA
jgi:hypothetical protein